MTDGSAWKERLVDRQVTYHIEVDGRLFVISKAVVRIADAIGVPLEEAKARMSVDLRRPLSLDG